MMKNRISMVLLAICLGILPPLSQAQPQPLDKVIAVVDEDVILQSQFQERLASVRQQFQQRGGAMPPADEMRRQVLDQLIIENLQMQMAARAGIRVDDNMLNQAMSRLAQQNNMTFDQFRQLLEREGVYRQTRNDIEREIVISQFRNRAVNQRINITRQEIENYLRSETGQSTIAPEYRVAHILIPASAASEARRQELADLLHRQLRDGADILELANEGRIAGIRVNGGDLGWNKKEGLPSLFAGVVPQLQAGDVAEPFTSGSGHHVVQLLETRGGANLTVDQTHVRHIQISPNQIRTEAQARQLAHDLYQRIQDGEDFADIARQHTDDPSSMVSGGDLDWVSPGQLPEDFMNVVDQTEVGEITEPFRAESGWHIVEVLDRRKQDVTEENKRYQARQVLRDRKFDLELENWLTELRDTAYIDIKDENLRPR